MAIENFQDIQAWQKAHALVLNMYRITKTFPKEELFSLTNQIRRAAISVPANIVEGFKRNRRDDSLNFYRIARASLEELKYHMLLARDLGYITEVEFHDLENSMNEAGKLLHGWIRIQK